MKQLMVAAAVAALVCSSAAKASTYDVNFQFTDGVNTETVKGKIVTTCDSCFPQGADITSWSLNFSGAITGTASSGPLNQSPPGIFGNQLEATGGELLYVFASGGGALFTNFVPPAQLEFGFNLAQGGIHVQDASFNTISGSVGQPFVIATEEIVTTPLPAALPLLATGLGALGLLGWRRKRTALNA
jgi:hypothetical protein